tara:strand:- start:721 stop:903 length:183 start_codon:yes stop_codon:yes gene_type:complete
MDLSDERFHRKRIWWIALEKEGYKPEDVLIEAQRQGLHKLAKSANIRIENVSRAKQKGVG